ncbi:MAG: SRPBCC domain-containing protein [Gemmatimonadota bacterium]
MSDAKTGASLKVVRMVKAAREQVFDAWTTPESLQAWCAPQGMDIPLAEVDLRVGGAFRIRMRDPGGSLHTATGTYREIDRPARLVFTWRWEEQPAHSGNVDTVVTLEFHQLEGATEVILHHEGFPEEAQATEHTKGWTSILERLAAQY